MSGTATRRCTRCAPGTYPDSGGQPPGVRLDVPAGFMAVPAWLLDGHIYLIWSRDLGYRPVIYRIKPGQSAEPVES